MSKKGGNTDSFKRINFLYQASNLLLVQNDNKAASSYYCSVLKSVSKRSVLRLNPTIKRTICTNCSSLLIPGITSTHRLKDEKESHITVTCQKCGFIKRYNTNKKRDRNKKRKQMKLEKKLQQQHEQQHQEKQNQTPNEQTQVNQENQEDQSNLNI